MGRFLDTAASRSTYLDGLQAALLPLLFWKTLLLNAPGSDVFRKVHCTVFSLESQQDLYFKNS